MTLISRPRHCQLPISFAPSLQAFLFIGSEHEDSPLILAHAAVAMFVQGRLIDHLRNSHVVGLEDLQVLVLDEADRLLGMGFTDEVCRRLLGPPC